MAGMRVYELARKLGVESKVVVSEIKKLGVEGKTHSSSISNELVNKIESQISKEGQRSQPKKETQVTIEKEKKVTTKKKVPPVSSQESEKKTQAKKGAEPPLKDAEEIEIPDRFKKAASLDKVQKLKPKPSMQRAFQSIRKIEPKKFYEPKYGKKGFKYQQQQRRGAHKKQVTTTVPRKKVLKIQEGTTVKEFAEIIGQKLSEIIKKFMELGYIATINQPLDMDAAILVADSYGIRVEFATVEELDVFETEEDDSLHLYRSPVVTIMGHVDHGKTSLLDVIRETKVTESEAGGITQHIGAYKVALKDKEIVFLDTPGHEAFTSMRARGAKVTDIVVLVVAADDGVMPQTVEAINHARAAEVPIIVAINKIDKADADPVRVKRELTEHGLIPEEWGGKSIFVEVSAKEVLGIEDLLEMIALQSEVMDLKANATTRARGIIIESRLDKGKGAIATVLIQSGNLKIGDTFISGMNYGRVRALNDDVGKRVEAAGPSTPVEVVGFNNVPNAGDILNVVEDEKKARQIALARTQKERLHLVEHPKKLNLDEIYAKIEEGEIKDLNVIIKADVQGSGEAIKRSLEGIKHEQQVQVRAIHTSVGGISESDVMLASASNAIIIGFNVRADAKAMKLSEKEGVDIRLYMVIYDAINDVKKALEGMLEPTFKERILGTAEVRETFTISRTGTIAGCYVTDGSFLRSSDGIRVIRDNIIIHDGKIASLKRFQEDVREVSSGYECGILLESFNDIRIGDIFENYKIEEVATKLS